MSPDKLNDLFESIHELTPEQQQELSDYLQRLILSDKVTWSMNDARERRFSDGLSCPYCGTKQVYRHGTYRDSQRYACQHPDCGRTFTETSCSPLGRHP